MFLPRAFQLLAGLTLATLLTGLPLRAQTVLFITNGDAATLQAVDTATGNLLYSATTTSLAYPIVVRDTIWLGHRDDTGSAIEYALANGLPTGNTAALPGTNFGNFVDGAAVGNFNYTLVAFTSSSTVYRTNLDWTNPVSAFTVSGNDIVGITYDTASGNLWISDQSSIYQYSLTGTLISQFAHAGSRGSLAYNPSSDTLWYVPNASGSPLLQYSKTGTLLQSLTVNGRSSNVWGAEFSVIPEPSTYALLGLGLAGLFWRHRRRLGG